MAEEMSQSGFESLAEAVLGRVFDALEAAARDDVEVDLEGGVLTVEVDGVGTYVLNKHGPMKQLWLSSPKSGAHHFAWSGARWESTRGGADLASLLAAELGVTLA
jgi:frataxin